MGCVCSAPESTECISDGSDPRPQDRNCQRWSLPKWNLWQKFARRTRQDPTVGLNTNLTGKYSATSMITKEQLEIVTQSKKMLEVNKGEIGHETFKTVMQLRPELKKLFLFDEMTEAEMEKDFMFQIHDREFPQLVLETINALQSGGDHMRLERYVTVYASHHVRVKGYTGDNFSIFGQVLLHTIADHLGEVELKIEQFAAWNSLMKYIIMRLKTAFQLARDKLQEKDKEKDLERLALERAKMSADPQSDVGSGELDVMADQVDDVICPAPEECLITVSNVESSTASTETTQLSKTRS